MPRVYNMPILSSDVFASSTAAKQRLLQQRHIHSAAISQFAYQCPLFSHKLFHQIFIPQDRKKERLQMLKYWETVKSHPVPKPLKDIYQMKREKPEEYRKWLGEKDLEFKIDRRLELEPSDLQMKFKIELLKHVDAIEQVLGYSFSHLENLLLLLPRFPSNDRRQRIRDVYTSVTLALLGRSAIGLAMRDSNKWQNLDDPFPRKQGDALNLSSFIIDHRTLKPMQPQALRTIKFIRKGGWKGDRISLVLLGLFGAIFRDGGMDALKKVIQHTKLLDKAKDTSTKLHDIGLNACEVLFINSLYKKNQPEEITQAMQTRCNESWHAIICAKPDVSQAIDAYYSSKTLDQGEGAVGGARDEWVDKEGKPLPPGLRYQTFLGATYRDGGLTQVKDILISHDPGYSCPMYSERLRKCIGHYGKMMPKHTFWVNEDHEDHIEAIS